MDHHCPWINNCVGHRNTKYFVQFCLYTCISASYLTRLMCASLYQFFNVKNYKNHIETPKFTFVFIMCVFGFFEGLAFTVFTFDMLNESIKGIRDN